MLKVAIAGAGSHGFSAYVADAFPRFQTAGRMQAVAVIEPVDALRTRAVEALGLSPREGFRDAEEALDRVAADVLVVATPFNAHEALCLEAARRGMALFIEKPVSDSLQSCCRIEEAVRRAGVKAAVNMSARFEPEKVAFARWLGEGLAGEIDYLFARLAWDHSASARYRADAPHPYLMEGGVHVLEMLRTYAGGRPARVFNLAWPVAHSVYSGKASAVVSFEMDNGVRCVLEGSWAVQAGINTWRDEYIRADGSKGALLLDHRRIHHLRGQKDSKGGVVAHELEVDPMPLSGTNYLFGAFLEWAAGRRADHPTALAENLQCMALLFAAIESAETGQVIDVQSFLKSAFSGAPS